MDKKKFERYVNARFKLIGLKYHIKVIDTPDQDVNYLITPIEQSPDYAEAVRITNHYIERLLAKSTLLSNHA